jgi:hypothetical protein
MMDAVRRRHTPRHTFLSRIKSSAALALFGMALQSQATVTPPAYNVEVSQASVSGLSSGGFMAVQLHVAYLSLFKAARASSPAAVRSPTVRTRTWDWITPSIPPRWRRPRPVIT